MFQDSRDALVLEHLPLVKSIALRLRESLPPCVDVDDLTGNGLLGLLDAASRFDPRKQNAFGAYARHRIRGAMLDSLRQMDTASRETRRQDRKAQMVRHNLTAELHREPTDSEVTEKLSLTDRQWRRMRLQILAAAPRTTDNGAPAADPAGETPDALCAREELRSFLARAMEGLGPRHRKVVTLYYAGELTMKEIGAILGVNESRISQMHKAALSKMNHTLQAVGIQSASALC